LLIDSLLAPIVESTYITVIREYATAAIRAVFYN